VAQVRNLLGVEGGADDEDNVRDADPAATAPLTRDPVEGVSPDVGDGSDRAAANVAVDSSLARWSSVERQRARSHGSSLPRASAWRAAIGAASRLRSTRWRGASEAHRR
jgi:hypothetical protein